MPTGQQFQQNLEFNREIRDAFNEPTTNKPQTTGEFAEHIKFIVQDISIPKVIKEDFFGFMDKENVLSNMTKEDILSAKNRLAIAQLTWIQAHPFSDFTWTKLLEFDNMEHKLNLKMSRSRDGFERRMQSTEFKHIETNRTDDQKKRSFFSKLFAFGRKDKEN